MEIRSTLYLIEFTSVDQFCFAKRKEYVHTLCLSCKLKHNFKTNHYSVQFISSLMRWHGKIVTLTQNRNCVTHFSLCQKIYSSLVVVHKMSHLKASNEYEKNPSLPGFSFSPRNVWYRYGWSVFILFVVLAIQLKFIPLRPRKNGELKTAKWLAVSSINGGSTPITTL